MNPLSIIKGTSAIVVSLGAGAVVKHAIQSTTPETITQFTKICVVVGGCVVGMMVSDAASKYASETIDEAADIFKKTKKTAEETTQTED